MKLQLLGFVLSCLTLLGQAAEPESPNIVFILWDDMGWNDLSLNGGQIPTPNMDSLFQTGVNLQRHYIHLLCGVSRSQFLTGRYAMYSGYGKMSSFGVGHPAGIPIGLPTVAQWIKAYKPEYTTYGVGKWMVGYAAHLHLPQNKGFDHFFGSFSSAISYDNAQVAENKCDACTQDRYDWQNDGSDYNKILHVENTMYEFRDKISEHLESEQNTDTPFYMFLPLQSPHGPLSPVADFHKDCLDLVGGTNEDDLKHRTKYCDVIMLSDAVVGALVDKLKETALWDNTLIVMVTDNGGDIENTGCNYPFRGSKGDLFEGNQRTVAVASGGVIPEEQRGTTRQSLMSSLDWTPTLLEFAGIYDQIDEQDRTWDGVTHYNMIMNGDDFVRDHIVLNAGLRNLDSAVVVFRYPMEDNKVYKYIATDTRIEKVGTLRTDGWCIPDSNGNWAIKVDEDSLLDDPEWVNSQPYHNKWLFDLEEDISEMNNILRNNPEGRYAKASLIDYAVSIVQPYTEHPMYSEFISGLWTYLEDEDKTSDGEFFIQPWMEKGDYMKWITESIEAEIGNHDNMIPEPLQTMYKEQWVPPNGAVVEQEMFVVSSAIAGSHSATGHVMMYAACAIVVVVAVISALVKMMTQSKHEYVPIE